MCSKIKKVNNIAGLFVYPAVHFYLLEAYTHNGFTEVRPWSQLFNLVLFELAAWILFLLIGSARAALLTEGIFAMLLGLVNYYVYTFRSLPIVPWDFLSIGTAAGVMGNYNFMPTLRVVFVVAGFFAAFCLEGMLSVHIKQQKWYVRLLLALTAVIGMGKFAGVLQQEEFQNRHMMYNKLFTPVYMWQTNGFVLTMVMELPFLSIEKPDGYQKESAEQIIAYYETKGEEENPGGHTPDQLPNIIVVMDEAFSDLRVLGEFAANEDEMPFVHSLQQGAANTVTGNLQVSVCGGNTANTEFEFLTGNTMAFLPQGSIPYQQYIKREIPALPADLKQLGYETYAQHPYYAGGWDRDTVYPLLGFDHTEFLEDFKYPEYIRKYVSDASAFDHIIRTYEEKEEGKPAFIFQVTMQNHGSYGEVSENFTPDIAVEGAPSRALSVYLSLLKQTDDALARMIDYFSKEDEPVVVVFFGDHQPNDTVAEPILRLNGKSCRTLSEEDTYLRYQVPYFIWANYEIEEKTNADTSANYLAGSVLEAAGIRLPAYRKFLSECSESFPVISAAGITQADGDGQDLTDYKKLQYYQLFDAKR